METPVGNSEQDQLPWVSTTHGSSDFPTQIPTSVPGQSFVITPSTELPTQYTTLSALQGSFITLSEYQSLHGSVGYQPIYISGGSFEGIPSDGDFVVAAGEDAVASSLQVLNAGQPPVQVRRDLFRYKDVHKFLMDWE